MAQPDPTDRQRRIVVGVDDSRCGRAALRWAARQAAAQDAVLVIVSAWSMTHVPRPPSQDLSVIPPEAEFQRMADAQLRRLVEEELGPEPAVQVELRAVHANSAVAVLEAAKDADHVVVGSRGRGGFAGLVLGSVSSQVVHHAPCPVTVVRN